MSSSWRKLQHCLSSGVVQGLARNCLSTSPSALDAARLRSTPGRGAGAWLEAVLFSARYALSLNEFCLASYLGLGQPLPFNGCITKCDCGSDLCFFGYHLLTCKLGGGLVWQHNSIVSAWSNCLNELQLHHCKEPRNLYIESDDHPDIVVFDPTNGTDTELDISMAHPWSKNTLKRLAEEAGYVAELQEIKRRQNRIKS